MSENTLLFLLFAFIGLCDPLLYAANLSNKNVGIVTNEPHKASSNHATILQARLQVPHTFKVLKLLQNLKVKKQDTSAAFTLKLDKNYTPLQIAEYIFNTGDENSVTQAVKDMLEDGQIMASRDDVIVFLENVQEELEFLKNMSRDTSSDVKWGNKRKFFPKSKEASGANYYSCVGPCLGKGGW